MSLCLIPALFRAVLATNNKLYSSRSVIHRFYRFNPIECQISKVVITMPKANFQ